MKNKKGFTLIELLAVIVILGLLLAIAIPSVTKYITQSRKKTLTSTIGNYIGALVNEVNDLNYTFTGTNTVYAVPIECIALERGGTNPFGKWHQASNAYWAYVLVQYDDDTSSYNYGYTFKDSAGYGLYPTTQAKLNENGKQIQTGLSLTKPTSGKVTNIAELDNWNGFDVDSSTDLVVLETESEGVPGDGVNTCTLVQKGDNYLQVEQEKAIAKEEASKDYTLMATTSNSTEAFWNYRQQIKTITFQDSINIPSDITDEHKWDVSTTGNGKVMAYITTNSSNSSYYDLYIQGDGDLYANPNSSALFYNFSYVDNINNIEILDTSYVTDMGSMFYSTGRNSTVFTLDLGDKFDTSNVTNMNSMFNNTGRNSTVFTLDLGDKFDTSSVTNMRFMFRSTGYSSTVFELDLGEKFNTSQVSDMVYMFDETGYSNQKFTLDLGDKFDTSNVTDMSGMFSSTGYSSTVFTLDLGDRFDTSQVTNMRSMFVSTGYSSTVFTLNLGDKFDTSKVTNMNSMFSSTGRNSTVFTLDLGDKFDTSKVTNMNSMFGFAGYSSTVFTLDLGNLFDTSKVTNMSYMFFYTGYFSTVFTLDLGDKFDTSNVTDMSWMFGYAGVNSTSFTLDLGDKFNTSKVTNMNYMFFLTGRISPVFTLNLGEKFDTSNVTNMENMFNNTGYFSTVFTLDLGDKFDTSNVTNMSFMFNNTGYLSPVFTLDCSNWNVDKVTSYSYFNTGVTSKVTPPKWVN